MYRTDYLNKDTTNEMDKLNYSGVENKELMPQNVPNEDLPFRTDDDVPLWIARPFHFLHAPIIKFIHHLVLLNYIELVNFRCLS